jgi:pimeloyl-[acyl-carrier protein] methyl ester esterase
MNSCPTLVILPGLDGTGTLSEAFAGGNWGDLPVVVLPLPTEGPQDYETLEAALVPQLPEGPLVFLGESFTSPLAARLAKRERGRVDALILAGGFCSAPRSAGFSLIPLRSLFLMKPPAVFLRRFLLGDDAPEEAVEAPLKAVESISAETLANRVEVVLALTEDECPSPEGLPVLLLQARNDEVIPWEAQSKLERHFPDAKVVWIEGPHLLLDRRPDKCREAVNSFLSGL